MTKFEADTNSQPIMPGGSCISDGSGTNPNYPFLADPLPLGMSYPLPSPPESGYQLTKFS